MYKANQKNAFIEYYLHVVIASETLVRAVFKQSEQFEIKFNKDVSMFTQEEIIELLKARHSRALYSLQNVVTILKHYTEYVIYFGYEAQTKNNYAFINKHIIKRCLDADRINSVILSRADIDDIQSNMLNAVDKAILECLFIGISGPRLSDLTELRAEQLHGNEIHLTDGRVFIITDWLSKTLNEAFEETELVSYGDTMQINEVIGRGQLYKIRCNAHKEPTPERRFRWVQRRLKIFREYFDIPILTPKTINTSGLVHEIRQRMVKTDLPLREFIKTPEIESLARLWGYNSADYVNTIYEKVADFI